MPPRNGVSRTYDAATMAAADQWFTVDAEVSVLDTDQSAPIGRLMPGRRYRAIGESDGQLLLRGPNGVVGVVPAQVASAVDPAARQPAEPGSDAAGPPTSERAPWWALIAAATVGLFVAVGGVALGPPIDDPEAAAAVQGAAPDSGSSSGQSGSADGSDSDGAAVGSVDPALLTAGEAEAPAGWVLVAFDPFDVNEGAWDQATDVSEEFGTAEWTARDGVLELTLEPVPGAAFDPNRFLQYRNSMQRSLALNGSVYVAAVATESAASDQAVSVCGLLLAVAGTRYHVNVNARSVVSPQLSVNVLRPGDAGLGEFPIEAAALPSAVDGANRMAVLIDVGRMTVLVNGEAVVSGMQLPGGAVGAVGVAGLLSGPSMCSWDNFEVRTPPGEGNNR